MELIFENIILFLNYLGAITLSKIGEIGVYFSSERMAWAYQKGNEVHYGIEHDQDEVEIADWTIVYVDEFF